MQGTTYAVRIGTSLVNERRNANITHVDVESVKHLTDSEIENALFYATLGDRDDDLVTLLRRDVIRRAINGNSDARHRSRDRLLRDLREPRLALRERRHAP